MLYSMYLEVYVCIEGGWGQFSELTNNHQTAEKKSPPPPSIYFIRFKILTVRELFIGLLGFFTSVDINDGTSYKPRIHRTFHVRT